MNRYYFNLTTPSDRDTYFIAKPLAPGTNLTTGWTGGQIGDGYVNVSAYEIATAAGRYGYWRILSHGTNMISDLEIYDPSSASWQRTVDLRAGNTSQVRVYVGTQFENSIVNITILDPDGSTWLSVNATVDATGYATSIPFVVDGVTANAGEWMVIASTNDIGTNGLWRSTGFFKRPFTVTHTSELLMHYPTDAIIVGQ